MSPDTRRSHLTAAAFVWHHALADTFTLRSTCQVDQGGLGRIQAFDVRGDFVPRNAQIVCQRCRVCRQPGFDFPNGDTKAKAG